MKDERQQDEVAGLDGEEPRAIGSQALALHRQNVAANQEERPPPRSCAVSLTLGDASDGPGPGDFGTSPGFLDPETDSSQTRQSFAAEAPPAMAGEIAAEADLLLDLSERARVEDASRMAKFSEADRHLKERKRGRRAAPRSDDYA